MFSRAQFQAPTKHATEQILLLLFLPASKTGKKKSFLGMETSETLTGRDGEVAESVIYVHLYQGIHTSPRCFDTRERSDQ